MSAGVEPGRVRSRKEKPQKRGVPAILRQDWYFAIALAAFVGVTVWFGKAIKDFLAPAAPTISTPSLVGQTFGDAVREASADGLRAVVVSRQNSDRFPKDIVMRQEPEPGSKVREGRQISVVVSNGVVIFPMPDLRDETMREVDLDLSHYKLALGKTKFVADDDIPANRVVSEDPGPLSSVRIGTVVNLELSKGPPPAVRLPSFIDMPIDDARTFAIDQRVRLGQIVWTPFGRSSPPRGTVVRQNPTAGQLVGSDARVSLQVSAGPDVTGYLVRQVHVNVIVPGSDAGEVKITVHDDTGTWDLYDAFAQPRQKLDFNVTVIGTANLFMYENGQEISTTVLGNEPKNVQHNQYPDVRTVPAVPGAAVTPIVPGAPAAPIAPIAPVKAPAAVVPAAPAGHR